LSRNEEITILNATWQGRALPRPGREAGSECWRAGAAGPARRGPGPGAPHEQTADHLQQQKTVSNVSDFRTPSLKQ